MSAIVKQLREKRGGFVVPLVDEVVLFIKEKKGWPDKFCKYYAEKFWNNYEASGWRLSNGNSMKSWQAAFNAQWQNVRYKDDIEFLAQCRKEQPGIVKQMNHMDKLNEILVEYKENFEKVSDDRLVKVYDYLKERRLIKMDREEVQFIKNAYGEDPYRGKAACVKMIFSKMINYGTTF
jgi:hypothetical protein